MLPVACLPEFHSFGDLVMESLFPGVDSRPQKSDSQGEDVDVIAYSACHGLGLIYGASVLAADHEPEEHFARSLTCPAQEKSEVDKRDKEIETRQRW